MKFFPRRLVNSCCLGLAVLSLTFIFAAEAQDAEQCARCHPAESRVFRESPMGNSIARPGALGSGRIAPESSGTVITVEQRDGRMVHRLTRGLTAEYPVAYQIGANRIGYSYLVLIGSYFFESPASWYRAHGLGSVARICTQG